MDPIAVDALELGHIRLPDWHPRFADVVAPVRAFVIHHPDGPILFDTGVGTDSALINELYDLAVVPIVDALADIGIDERDIVAIVNSHFHFDHCGQNPAFPSTPVFVRAEEVEAAKLDGFTVPEWAHVDEHRARHVGGDEEVAPGVRLLETPGHTPGHQSILLGPDGSEQRLLVGQCCYTCAEFETGMIDPADVHDESFLEVANESLARLRALDVANAHFSHDPTDYARRDGPES